jgi:hypothetical protein
MMDDVWYGIGFEDGYRTAIKDVMDGSFTDGSFPHTSETTEQATETERMHNERST